MPERGKKRGLRAESPSSREAAEARTPLWREARTPVRPDGAGLGSPCLQEQESRPWGLARPPPAAGCCGYWLPWPGPGSDHGWRGLGHPRLEGA